MSSVIQTGSTPDGFPIYGLAPEPAAVPAHFWFDMHWLRCKRSDCRWEYLVDRDGLTEIVAVAREHVEEAHRAG